MNPGQGPVGTRRLGVCSWSLRPRTPEELVQSVRACGLSAVQLALDPIRESEQGGGAWGLERTRRALDDAGISILSGMIATIGEDYSTLESIRRTGGVRPGGHWEGNLERAVSCARIARALGLDTVTFHAGFVPENPHDKEFDTMAARVAQIGEVFGECDCAIALETGQESARALMSGFLEAAKPEFQESWGSPWINFDPANMILYGSGDPVAALELLAPSVRQVHIKDALPAQRTGEWGTEVSVGEGAVDWPAFFRVLDEGCADVDLVIEREAGESRVEDVIKARELVRRYL
jgi:sugar phosphate isomerase/epimerase